MVKSIACSHCDVEVLSIKDAAVAQRAKDYGIARVPAVVIDGKQAECCAGRGPDVTTLRAAGLGQSLQSQPLSLLWAIVAYTNMKKRWIMCRCMPTSCLAAGVLSLALAVSSCTTGNGGQTHHCGNLKV
ncbi:MAG: hypothetical protein M3R04_10355 [bacterium]|nr:hypothetical protein [bacterium]